MTVLEHALAHAAAGRPVFPLRAGSKKPPAEMEHWPDKATCDPETVRGWFSEGDCNIGFYCGRRGAGTGAYLAVDIDPRHGGDRTFEELDQNPMHEGFPATMTVRTPSGGRHLIYTVDAPLATTTGKLGAGLGPGLDTRSSRGYVVAVGSTFNGRPYEYEDARDPVPAPAWLVEKVGTPSAKREKREQPYEYLDAPHLLTRATEYLRERAPIANEDGTGNGTTYRVACVVRDCGVGEDTALELMLDHWNDRCGPPWDRDELAVVVGNAFRYAQRAKPPVAAPQEFDPVYDESLTVAAWLARDIPEPDFLMGRVFSTTNKAMLVAPTGLGKTNFGIALAASMALGKDFLHWRAARAARVLYVDGEMSSRLVRKRLADAVRRAGAVPSKLHVMSRDADEEIKPLNTKDGQAYIDKRIERIGGIDFVIFDNVMSLISGDMKEEDGWSATLPWAKSLTRRSIGQCWIHHTGINETRSYGTSTREWQLDTVALMERAKDSDADIAFDLRFTKAREREPANRADFETVRITLAGDRWTVGTPSLPTTLKPPSPKALAFHAALASAIAKAGSPQPDGRRAAPIDAWRSECGRAGLVDLSDGAPDNKVRALVSKYRLELVAAGWIEVRDDLVFDLASDARRFEPAEGFEDCDIEA